MKIYFFEQNIDKMGGVERIISTLANCLINKYEVEVISVYQDSEKPFFEYDERILRTYIKKFPKMMSKKYTHNKLIYYFFRIFEKLYEKTIMNYKIKKVIKKIKDDDILIFGRLQVAIKFMPFLNKKAKIIVRDANHYYVQTEKEKDKIKIFLEEYAKLLIVSSDESMKVYEKVLGNNHCKFEKIYNPLGINSNKGYNFDNKKIISIGRYDKQKGYEVLIRAFAKVILEKPDWTLEIVGNNEPLKDTIEKYKLENNVILSPSSKDVVKKLNESSIFVMTSRYEGYANALVESLACGVPSISFNWLLGVDEIIKNKVNGLVVELKDRFKYAKGIDNEVDAINLANAILKLINDKELCQKYSDEAFLINESRRKEKIISKWLNIIEEMSDENV